MKTLKVTLAAMLFSAVGLANVTSKTYTVSGAISLSIPYSATPSSSNHQFASLNLGMNIHDNSGALIVSGYSKSQNTSTYDITLNFSGAFYGTVDLYGPFDTTTSASTDFAVTGSYNSLKVCSACTRAAYARRYGSSTGTYHLGIREVTFTQSLYFESYDLVRVWLDSKNRVVFGMSSTSTNNGATCSGGANGHCLLQWGISDYPSGVTPLGHGTFTDSGYAFVGVTDDRPW